MKNPDGGQLYTIEGFAAGLIMVITAYLVVNATSVYTAGDTHINDMQLEQLGNDALTVMGTPMNTADSVNGSSTLRSILEEPNSITMQNAFRTEFLGLVNTSAGGLKQDIQYNATYTCRKNDNSIEYHSISSSIRNASGDEHPVRATKWVIINRLSDPICDTTNQDRAVLVEVLLWRD
jgi:hypothetical protein